MLRTPGLSPYHARFLVPLDFSKYDLRDYLYHAYNVKCFNVRSYVKQMPIRDTVAQPRHWFRPESKKYMTVEMEEPFVWPALPENTEPWGIGNAKSELETAAEANGIVTTEQKRQKAKSLREQVKKLLMKKEPLLHNNVLLKKQAGQKLTPEEQEKYDIALQKKDENTRRSALDFWEEKRSMKAVQADESSRYTIKV